MIDLRKKMEGKNVAGVLIAVLIFLMMVGCMNIRRSETISDSRVSKEQFSSKTVAVLPVKAQSTFAPDALMPLRMALNEKLDEKVREKITGANIVDTKTSVNILNDKGKIEILDDIIKTYDNTGVFDKRLVESLGNILKSDYTVFSRLKAEKTDAGILGKGFASSLQIIILENAKNEMVWAGSGEFQRGGVFGFGSTENKQAAEELVNLAFEKF